jgi:mercuric ion binding protein
MKKLLIAGALLMAFNTYAEEVKVKVSGMVCSMCAQGIQKKFSKEDSIHHISVNMDEKIVTIQTKDGKNLPDETIKKLITEAGYNVATIERK